MHRRDIDKTTFHYNSDMSSDVLIVRDGVSIVVPAKDLVAFVIERAIGVAISRLERIDPEKLWKWLSK